MQWVLGRYFNRREEERPGKDYSTKLQGRFLPMVFFPVIDRAEYFIHSGKEEWENSIFQAETRKTGTFSNVETVMP